MFSFFIEVFSQNSFNERTAVSAAAAKAGGLLKIGKTLGTVFNGFPDGRFVNTFTTAYQSVVHNYTSLSKMMLSEKRNKSKINTLYISCI